MNIAVTSDIHGNARALERIISLAKSHKAYTLLIAGDFGMDSLSFIDIEYLGVRGNCDSPYDFSLRGAALPPLTRTLTWEGRTIFMTHGHRIFNPALKDGDIMITGHTHRPLLQREGNIIHINPGSPTFPRSGSPSWALLEPERITLRTLSLDFPYRELSLKS